MRGIIKKITNLFFRRAFLWYHSKPRKYSYKGISVNVSPEVFPPHFTISTKILLGFLAEKELKNKSVLELGCGSGIISLFCVSKGANVLASDINIIALENLEEASKDNNLPLETIKSDLFDAINKNYFDYIIINPPYYPKNPIDIKEQAWFCGENFEYFNKLFYQLVAKVSFENVFMILSEDCELNKIKSIALENGLVLENVLEKKVYLERNYIFKVAKK